MLNWLLFTLLLLNSPRTCMRVFTRSSGAHAIDESAPDPTPANREAMVFLEDSEITNDSDGSVISIISSPFIGIFIGEVPNNMTLSFVLWFRSALLELVRTKNASFTAFISLMCL